MNKYRERNRRFLWQILESSECLFCGEDNPEVLEFDHVSGEKKFNISDGVLNKLGLDTLEEEIRKCIVLCANCHRKKTSRESSWTMRKTKS